MFKRRHRESEGASGDLHGSFGRSQVSYRTSEGVSGGFRRYFRRILRLLRRRYRLVFVVSEGLKSALPKVVESFKEFSEAFLLDSKEFSWVFDALQGCFFVV